MKIIEAASAAAGITRREIDDKEIVERTIYALINEGANILDEGFAMRSVDIDIMYIFGYGFPPHKGGPMWFADSEGLDKVYKRVCDFEAEHGSLWAPAPLLKKLSDSDGKFAQFKR